MSNLDDPVFDDYSEDKGDHMPGIWKRLLAEKKAIQESGYPEPHYDEEDCCPCPDHVAMRWYRAGQ